MNFTVLRYFLEVAEDGNITHTANRLHISQQALSSQINKLEKELGVVLFERSPAFCLTYAGQRLRLQAADILRRQEEIYRESSDIIDGERCRLSIGVSYTCGRAILPLVLPGFCRQHPLVEINLMEGNSAELEHWLEHREIDCMIAFEPIRVIGAETMTLCHEQLMLVVPKPITRDVFGSDYDKLMDRCSRQADIRLFRDVPFIMLKQGNRAREMLDDYMVHSDFHPNVLLETENSETALALAQTGMGATVFSQLFLQFIHPRLLGDASRPIDIFPLAAQEARSELVIARLSKAYHPRLVDSFLQHCIDMLQE